MRALWSWLTFILIMSSAAWAVPAWRGEVPVQARESRNWVALLDALKKNNLPYGAMAASARMLSLFSDLETKEIAYHAVIELIDRGYPFSVNKLFASGDLEARGEPGFVNSYNLVKYVINHEKGMERWAQQYYEKMDHEGFSKYQFYLAIQSYSQGKNNEAIERLRKILAADSGEGSGSLAIRSARTLARLYFEQKSYEKSLGIYTSFLLKLNPIEPSDWLEAAWSDYYLKRYPEALGMLYNLESRVAGAGSSLEKYTLRALIYRDNCAVASAEALVGSFDREFGAALTGIKEGNAPENYPVLARVVSTGAVPFQDLMNGVDALKRESVVLDDQLPPAQRAFAHGLYDSEIKFLQAEARGLSKEAFDHSAEQLVIASESLKFLKYDVSRQKYDPDQVFQGRPRLTAAVSPLGDFQIRWPQQGDFWRNERINFRGEMSQQCTE